MLLYKPQYKSFPKKNTAGFWKVKFSERILKSKKRDLIIDFLLKYSKYLPSQYFNKENKPLCFDLFITDDRYGKLQCHITCNYEEHISFELKGFHRIQLKTEAYSAPYCSFFEQLHEHVKGNWLSMLRYAKKL